MSETYNRDHTRVECPYCGAKNDLSEAIGARGEDVTAYECGNCDHRFATRVHVSISVTANKLEFVREETKGGV